MYGEPFHKIAFRYNTRFKLSKTEGEDLDGSYENLIAESGYVLDMVSPKEEAYAIMDMMESLRPQPNVSSGANTMEQSYDAALEIFGKYYEMQARTEANEKAKKYINELRQKQKVMQEKNALRMKSHIRDIRTQEEAKRKEQADYYKEKLENAKKSKSAAIAAKDREAADRRSTNGWKSGIGKNWIRHTRTGRRPSTGCWQRTGLRQGPSGRIRSVPARRSRSRRMQARS
jgi:hypothetical protein